MLYIVLKIKIHRGIQSEECFLIYRRKYMNLEKRRIK